MIAWSILLLLCQFFSLGLGYGETPVTQPPVAQPPVAQPPVAQPPVAQPPVAQPPVAQPPVAQPPVAQPPVVQPPPSMTPTPPPGVPCPPTTTPPATPPPATPTPPIHPPTTPPTPPQTYPPTTPPTPPQTYPPTTPPTTPPTHPPTTPPTYPPTPPLTPPPTYPPHPPVTPGTPPSPVTPPSPIAPPGSCTTEIIIPSIASVVKQSLTVYYEAMEPNSQLFFNKTLLEAFNVFYPYVDLNYVPCQQAQVIEGELFCYSSIDPMCTLNMVHACAISQTEDKLILSKFLMCTMKGTAALPDYNTCATQSGINTTKLQTCLTTDLGKQLCIAFSAQKPNECTSMPGFIYKNPKDIKPKDPFNHFLNDACGADFVGTTCAVLKSSKKPAPVECNAQKLAVSFSYKIMDENSYKVLQEWAKLYDKFAKFISIKFQPCMFAEMGSGHLDCKAGDADKDCVTGRTHSCAISLVKDEVALFKFIACTTVDHTKLPDFQKCANDNKIDFKAVQACVDSGLGTFMCYQSSKTRPNTKDTPMVRFEMKFNQAASKESWTNLQFVLCQEMKYYNLTHPEDCKSDETKVSIFYDSLSSRFQCFLTSTFMENYQKFSPFVNFDFVPCRTAKEENGNLACSNPLDNKCYIDKFESCTVKNYPDNNVALKVLLCLSQFEGELFPGHEACVTAAKVDGAKLKACADGDEGKKLCIDNMNKSPKNDRVISYQINDKYDDNIDKSLGGDLFKGLCDYLKNNKLQYPVDCYPPDK